MGCAGAPLLTAQASYVTTCGYAMAERNRELKKGGEYNPEVMVSKFFGIFFFFFEVTQVLGNFISTAVLATTSNATLYIPDGSLSNETRFYIDDNCGSTALLAEKDETCPEPPPDKSRYILVSVYIALGLVAMLLCFFFLDNIKIRSDTKDPAPKQLILNTARHAWNDKKQQLLIVLTMYSGFKQAFLAADLTEGYIGCALGTEWIGFILMGYGAIDSSMSWVAGKMGASLGGRFGRGYLLGVAFGIDIVLFTALLLWRPYPTSLVPFFWVAMLYGTSDAIFQTQLYTMYGVLFNDRTDAAFANFRFWEALGFCISYGYSPALDQKVKCYIMLGILLVAIIGYSACEWLVSEEAAKQTDLDLEEEDRRKSLNVLTLPAPPTGDFGKLRAGSGQTFATQSDKISAAGVTITLNEAFDDENEKSE